MNILKKSLAMFLVLCMLVSLVPVTVFAAESDSTIPETEVAEATTEEQVPVVYAASNDSFMKVFHLDCGRKYFTVDQVKELIDAISNVGFSHMELAIGNDGLRLLLDDMSVTANGTTYASDTVSNGIKSGNSSYSHSGEWSQSEMDAIISYAASKGVEIIPLVNNPGHMDSILAAMNACGIDGYYETSSRTVDLENAEAVAFTQALVMKYAEYFASKGCKYFNIGADEYANDYHTADSTGMGFGYLIDNNLYGNFVTYVNALVADICDLGMTPIAFNDGIYFRENTSFGTFDNRLMIASWSGGWGGIKPASTTFLVNKGHKILNTNERWYYVLGRKQSVNGTYCYESALSNAQSESVTTVTDHTGATPIGAMQCVWCDDPSVDYEAYKTNVMTIINTLAENNSDYFTGPNVVLPETVTKTDEATGVSGSAPGLSELIVNTVEDTSSVPAIEGAGNVRAFDVSAFVDGASYTGEIELSIPVPAEWTRVRGGVLASASGEAVLGIEGKLENGMFTFTAPHLSGVVVYDVAYDVEIKLGVGQTHTITFESKNLEGNKYTPAPSGVATVTVKNEPIPGETKVVLGDPITPVNQSGWSDTGVIKSGNYYLVIEASGNIKATTDISEATVVTVARSSSNRWTIKSGDYYLCYDYRNGVYGSTASYEWRKNTTGFYFSFGNNYYLYYDNGWTVSNNASGAQLYDVSTTSGPAVDNSIVTITGIAPGVTYVDIEGKTYKVVVSKGEVSDILTVDEVKIYADDSANVVIGDSSLVDATVDGESLTITAKAVGTTTVTTDNAIYTIEVVDFDPDAVDPLKIEFWITNHPVTPDNMDVTTSYEDTDGDTQANAQSIWVSIPVTRENIYSENGVELSSLVSKTGVDSHKTSNEVVFWKGVALDTASNQQTTAENDNEAYNGSDFTKVRFWSLKWQVYTDEGWIDVSEATQLVAYYLQKTIVTNLDVVQTEVVDWGEIYGESDWSDSKFVVLDFAIQYEDGTRNPDSFAVDNKTMMFHCDYNNALNKTVFKEGNYYYRRIGTIHATETANYEVYMITITPNSDTKSTGVASSSGNIGTINYNGTEKVVWVDNEANLGAFEDESLQHEDFTVGGEPTIEKVDIYNQHAVLITYYVRAKVTEDALTVHYMDETAGNIQFYEYSIAVAAGTFFDENIALPNPWKGNLENGEVQTIDKYVIQTVSSDLETLPAVAAQYLYSQYECVRVTRSTDGKHVYLYYTFNPTVTFVADFGLPIVINGTDLSATLGGNVADMSVTGSTYTDYGRLTDNGSSITYTPTKIMQGSDFFTILVTTNTASGILDDKSTQVAFRVYVVPATTVYYEESFIDWDSNWSGGDEAVTVGNQTTEVLGEKVNNFGYDPAYDPDNTEAIGPSNATNASATKIGAKGTFTFTGNGIQVFANATEGSGYVSVQVKNSAGSIVNMSMVDTVVDPGTTQVTTGQTGELYGLPIVSLVNLTNMDHDTYTVTITKIMDTEPVYIDGIRVFNTVEDSTIFTDDLEDNPDFYELRDHVLKAVGANNNTSIDYKDVMYQQVYDANAGAAAIITDESVDYANSSTVQDLLDNGPKNEIYLYGGQTLTFKVKTNRVIQIGLKTPNGRVDADISVVGILANDAASNRRQTVDTSVDMFYTLVDAPVESEKTYTVSISHNSSNILSVTLLKICDDPNAALVPLTLEDIETIMGGEPEAVPEVPEEPVVPEEPEDPEVPEETQPPVTEDTTTEGTEGDETEPPEVDEDKPTKPNKPGKEDKPNKPNKPGKEDKPNKNEKPNNGNNNSNKPGKNDKTDKNDQSQSSSRPSYNMSTVTDTVKSIVSMLSSLVNYLMFR